MRELNPASPWCQRWASGRAVSWRHRSEGGFDAARYGVALLPEVDAKAFVLERHYSGTFPAARLSYGLWDLAGEFPALAGVAVLSVPASRRVLTKAFPDLEAYAESVELGRFVLADDVPGNGETWFLAEVLRLAAAQGVRGVVSFADPMPRTTLDGRMVFAGHRGAIYQAKGAEYTGRGTARTLLLLPDAQVLSARALQKIRSGEQGHEYAERLLAAHGAPPRADGESGAEWLRHALGAARVRSVRHPGNHRYLMRAGTPAQRRRVRVALSGLPYPKDTGQGATLTVAA